MVAGQAAIPGAGVGPGRPARGAAGSSKCIGRCLRVGGVVAVGSRAGREVEPAGARLHHGPAGPQPAGPGSFPAGRPAAILGGAAGEPRRRSTIAPTRPGPRRDRGPGRARGRAWRSRSGRAGPARGARASGNGRGCRPGPRSRPGGSPLAPSGVAAYAAFAGRRVRGRSSRPAGPAPRGGLGRGAGGGRRSPSRSSSSRGRPRATG